MRASRRTLFFGGVAASLAAAALWHGPLGAGNRLAARSEQVARLTLDHYEVGFLSAQVARAPLRRRLELSGRADDFQRAELLRMMREVPGIWAVRWTDSGATRGSAPLPLFAEAGVLALLGFSIGLFLAYLVAVRRRARQWDRF